MKTFLKIFTVIIIVLIASVFILPFAFKGKIVEAVQNEANKNLNAKLSFADLNLSLISNFPNITAELQELSIVGIDTFKLDTLVEFKSFKATLDIMSVISGEEINVKEIIIKQPNVYIKVLENGFSNYEIVKEDSSNVDVNEGNGEDAKFKINLDKFEIVNAFIDYNDYEGDMFANIKNMNYVLKGDMTEKITNLDMKLLIDTLTVKNGGVKYLNNANLDFSSVLKADIENSIYTFKENNLKLNEVNMGFDGFVEMPNEDIKIDIKFNTKDAKFKDVLSLMPAIYMSDFKEVKTKGVFNTTGYVKGVLSEKNTPAYGVKLIVKNGEFKYPELPKSVKNINVDMKIDAQEGSGDNINIDIKKASMKMANNPFSIKTFLKMTAYDTSVKGNIKGKLDLNSVKDVMPLEDMILTGIIEADVSFDGKLSDIENENYENFDAKGDMQVHSMQISMEDMPKVYINNADMNFSPQFVDLKKCDVKIGKSDFHLIGKIDNLFAYVFKDEVLKGKFNYSSHLLDVDELMASMGGDENASGNNKNETNAKNEVVEIPSNIDFVLNSSIDKLLYDDLVITNAKGLVIIKDSKLDMQQLKMNMLGGAMVMNGTYDSQNKEKPFADFDMKIDKISIAETSKAFLSVKRIAPIIENSFGDISGELSFKSVLDGEMMPILKSIMSSGKLYSNNIKLKNSKIFNLLAKKTKQTRFGSPKVEDLDISYKIINGILNILPTDFKIGGSKISFAGIQSIDQKIDFNLGMLLPKNIAGSLLSNLPGNSNKDVNINANIGGTANDPKIVGFKSGVTDGIINDVVKKVEEAKKKANEAAKKIIADAKKQADKIISIANNQAQSVKSQANKAGGKLVSEAEKQGDRLIREAKNPIAKIAAKETKKQLILKAKKQAKSINNKADVQANKIINTAQKKSDKIMSDARKRAKI